MLDHEKLDAYQCAIVFLSVALRVAHSLPRGNADAVDQLRRAAMSIPLNIAEGVGKVSPADRARFFAIARGSAMECGALLDVGRLIGGVAPADFDEGKALLVRIVSMLSRMCR
jgi:four helix bundle protein